MSTCIDKNGNILKQGQQVKVIGPIDEYMTEEMIDMINGGKTYKIEALDSYDYDEYGILVGDWWFDNKNVIAIMPVDIKDIKPKGFKTYLFDIETLVT